MLHYRVGLAADDIGGTLSGYLDRLIANKEAALIAFVICVLLLVGLLYYIFKNYDKLRFGFSLKMLTLFEGGRRRSILNFLRERGYPVEVLNEDRGKKRYLCVGKVVKVGREEITMRVLKNKGLSTRLKGEKIFCYYRPVWHFHMRSNCFQSFFLGMGKDDKGDTLIKVKMPLATDDFSRRRFKRKRIKVQRTIITRVWKREPSKSGGDRFRFSPPTAQVNVEYAVAKRNMERVFDVCERGIRIGVLGNLIKEKLEINDDVLVEVRPFVRQEKSFQSFFFGGKVRHVKKGRNGMTVMGLEFEVVGRRGYGALSDMTWEEVDESPAVRQFLKAIVQL